MVARYHRMMPEPGSPHLGNFERAFQQYRRYVLLPAVTDPEGGSPQILEGLDIFKQEVSFLQADQLTRKNSEYGSCLESRLRPSYRFDRHHLTI